MICNVCGESCVLEEDIQGQVPSGLIDAVVAGGYSSTPGNGSGALDDMRSYKFSICEFCLDWLFSAFKVPVEASDYGARLGTTVKWKPASQRVDEDEWRSQKDRFHAESARREACRTVMLLKKLEVK